MAAWGTAIASAMPPGLAAPLHTGRKSRESPQLHVASEPSQCNRARLRLWLCDCLCVRVRIAYDVLEPMAHDLGGAQAGVGARDFDSLARAHRMHALNPKP